MSRKQRKNFKGVKVIDPSHPLRDIGKAVKPSRSMHPLLCLQRLVGNQAVSQLVQSQLTSDRAAADTELSAKGRSVRDVQATGTGGDSQNLSEHKASVPERNGSRLPARMQENVERLSGLSMDDVRVYYDSPRPNTIGALAYASGTDIHLGPGQERHLGHEAWHVVQQKTGRVPETSRFHGHAINDNASLEQEADRMNVLLQRKSSVKPEGCVDGAGPAPVLRNHTLASSSPVMQALNKKETDALKEYVDKNDQTLLSDFNWPKSQALSDKQRELNHNVIKKILEVLEFRTSPEDVLEATTILLAHSTFKNRVPNRDAFVKQPEKKVATREILGLEDVQWRSTNFHAGEMKQDENIKIWVDPRQYSETMAKLIRAKKTVDVPEFNTVNKWVLFGGLIEKITTRLDIEAYHEREAMNFPWQRVKLQPGTGQQGGWLFYCPSGESRSYSTLIIDSTFQLVAKERKYLLVCKLGETPADPG